MAGGTNSSGGLTFGIVCEICTRSDEKIEAMRFAGKYMVATIARIFIERESSLVAIARSCKWLLCAFDCAKSVANVMAWEFKMSVFLYSRSFDN